VEQITKGGIRVRSVEHEGAVCVQFDVRDKKGGWRTLAGNGLYGREHWWSQKKVIHRPDPQIEWKDGGGDDAELQSADGVFTSAARSKDKKSLVFTGKAGGHSLEMTLTPLGGDRVHITVKDKVGGPVRIGRVMSHFFLIPDGRADRTFEPLEFAWMPNLHWTADGVCGDHFFRSPAVVAYGRGLYAGIVPDLDVFAKHCSIQHALDLRTFETGRIEAPRLSYGICPYDVEGHVYTKHDRDQTVEFEGGELCYAFNLFLGLAESPESVSKRFTSFIWDTYGSRYFQDIRPQVLPFEEYGRRYTYVHELPRSIRSATIGGAECTGIHNFQRRGSNFHAWENDLVVGFGIKHYAEKWRDEKLRGIADGIFQLIQHAPRKKGAFPCIYNFDDGRYEGTLFWTARAADFLDGYDTAAMGVTSWWLLNWADHFDIGRKALGKVTAYARFLKSKQLPSGAVPTYFWKDLTPAGQLAESATTAISGAVLAKVAKLTGDPKLKKAALEAGRFVDEQVMPGLKFSDFEVYYSCSPKPLYAVDYWSGIHPHNNLSIGWACDQMLALYQLTSDKKWLQKGEFLLSILSFYQQAWDPAHRTGHLYGGFGVMNTDGEWNDGRQARFTHTYADYYSATGNTEYLERAVAACRSTFALMDMPENHENEINYCILNENLFAPDYAERGVGYAGENVHHGGRDTKGSGWTGLNWSSGGGLTSSAYLERLFGGVWVDGAAKSVTPIDGVRAVLVSWKGKAISLKVESALTSLKAPFKGARDIAVKFGHMTAGPWTITINGETHRGLSPAALANGITVHLAE